MCKNGHGEELHNKTHSYIASSNDYFASCSYSVPPCAVASSFCAARPDEKVRNGNEISELARYAGTG